MSSMVVVVPWFSKEEWLETYKAAFSDDVCRWRDAKDTMLVWQARVEKLPAGIDVTLPLLQAKIVEADPNVENAVKSIFLASALQRFVTSIVKLPQTNYYRAQSMHNLALEIGLPMHLVDLRNEIVHGHGGWAGGETVHKALEVSYKWIKGYYWDAEFEKMHSNQSGISPEEWEDFLFLLKDYTKLIISFAKKKRSAYLKVKKGLIQSLVSLYSMDPEECMKAIVSHVLLPEASSDLAKHLGSEYSKLSSEWICLISGALLELKCFCSQEYHCASHSVMLEEPREGVDWKRVVVELLEAQSEWSTDIAFK
ncbi:Ribosomal biogenesis protein LAS1L [Chionoecetes opilio]|uniref:Ribosomal biogenesis protein LAS1L n=1 Tax=Chionoecetes opilio TaxID=41210 RepID=A0A8J4YEG7_CHIOP|nr:Ribosomal biogenesis protein LAS1L [Chionoecetes opilio]